MTGVRDSKPLVIALLMCFVTAHGAEKPRADAGMDVYARPGRLVNIGDSRHLNLRCSGKGAPTILLESGNNADSMTWFKVQPALAGFTRVCSYDRAGTGFSDGGPLPRNLDVNAQDLFALIHAAHIATPVVLVGHSYGTNVVRRFGDNHAAEVAALILLDPPPQNVGAFSPEFEKADAEQRLAMQAKVRQCERGAEEGKLGAPEADLKDCLRPPNPAFSPALNAALRANKTRPAFWQTIVSLSEANGELYKQPVDANESHGAIPLLILQPDTPFADAPPQIQQPMEQARLKTQQAIAATSTRGKVVPVAHSSHDVQLDRPDAVIDAVRAVIAAHGASSGLKP
jgi:pimeloyl-ACP methyl ester carboxylesterase